MENIRLITDFKFSEQEYADFLAGIEIWRKITDYEDYQVSTFGRIKSFKHKKYGKIGKPTKAANGYMKIQLYNGFGGYVTRPVHCIMGEEFLQNPDCLPEINHDNLIKDCNMLWNIEWSSRVANMQHASRHGRLGKFWRGKTGSECPHSIPVNQYDMNGNLIQWFGGVREASRITGIDRSGIGCCTRGEKSSYEGFKWVFADK